MIDQHVHGALEGRKLFPKIVLLYDHSIFNLSDMCIQQGKLTINIFLGTGYLATGLDVAVKIGRQLGCNAIRTLEQIADIIPIIFKSGIEFTRICDGQISG